MISVRESVVLGQNESFPIGEVYVPYGSNLVMSCVGSQLGYPSDVKFQWSDDNGASWNNASSIGNAGGCSVKPPSGGRVLVRCTNLLETDVTLNAESSFFLTVV